MKILIADDHALFRAGMHYVLAGLAKDVSFVEANDGAEALQRIELHHDLSLVLLDLSLPVYDGFAVLEAISNRNSVLPVVVLSGSDSVADMRRALDAGAVGYIPKSENPRVMLSALKLVIAGGIYVPPAMVTSDRVESRLTVEPVPMMPLTARQSDVLRCVFEGKPNKIIAAELNLAEATVKAHITAVFRALKVSNRTQAARVAQRLGLTVPSEQAQP